MVIQPVIRNRRTGQIVAWSRPLSLDKWPFRVENLSGKLWKYGDFWKFKSLFTERKLYFRRADQLTDKNEGCFSSVNSTRRSDLFKNAFQDLGLNGTIDQIIKIQEMIRFRVFLSCWHKNNEENPRMWSEYTQSSDSIVLIASKQRLVESIKEKCNYFDVIYENDSFARPELHSLAPFVYKRINDFEFENEFRFLYQLRNDESIHLTQPGDFGRSIAANPAEFLEEIRFHPHATGKFKNEVTCQLNSLFPKLRINDSVLSGSDFLHH